MKKLIFGLALWSLGLVGFSQSNSLGINAGFGDTWIKNYGNTQFKTHGNFGLAYVHSTKSRFGFGADLKYSLEGGEGENQTGTMKHETSLHYIRIPVKAMFFFGNYGQRLRPKVQVGPSFGFLVSTNDRFEDTRTGSTSAGQGDDFYNNFDVGIQGGAGVHYRLVKNTWFTADLNYYNGFRDIRQANSGGSPRNSNNNVSANFGVLWGIGK